MQFKTVQNAFFFVLLAFTTIAFLWLIQAFLQPIFWATVLSIVFYPIHRRWLHLFKERASLASVATLLTIIVSVLAPLFLIGLAVSAESIALYQRIASGEIDIQAVLDWFERLAPAAVDLMGRFGMDPEGLTDRLSETGVVVSQFIASQILAIGRDALRFTVLLFVMLYVLFFFLRDGSRLVDALIRTLPLGDVRERRLVTKFAEVSRATLKGTLVIGAIQGGLGGLLFFAVGIGAPIFWGVIMTVLSILPAVGAALIWVPAAIFLFATGEIVRGVIVVVFGALVISIIDNVLRPILVGKDTQMPDALVLLSTLGGLMFFGITGFVIGPIIAAFFLVVWEMFAAEFSEPTEALAQEESDNNPPAMLPGPEPDETAENDGS